MNERLKQARKSLKLTRATVAEHMHMAENYIYMVESGRHSLSDKYIFNFCERYGVNEKWVRTGEGEMFAPRQREAEIAKIAADIFNGDDSDMRIQLQKIVAELSAKEIETLVDIAGKVAEAKEKSLKK